MSYQAAFDDKRQFGIEIELFGIPRNKIAKSLQEMGIEARVAPYGMARTTYWRISTDSSIAGRWSAEVISPVLRGQEGLDEVRKVMVRLGAMGCKVNHSCAFHVHWNCTDFTGRNMLSLLRLYAKFERVIDYLVEYNQRGNKNQYCRSMIKDNDLSWVKYLDKGHKAIDVVIQFMARHPTYWLDRFGELQERQARYHKLNIAAYASYGTVEFRQHHGTLWADEAVQWIIFTQQLINKAKQVAVSPDASAKPTLGELLRTLKLVDHAHIAGQCTDVRVLQLGPWLKQRYSEFKEVRSQ